MTTESDTHLALYQSERIKVLLSHSDLRTTRARLLDMFTDITCTPEIMKNATDAYFSLLQSVLFILHYSIILDFNNYAIFSLVITLYTFLCLPMIRLHCVTGWRYTGQQDEIYPEL